METSIEPTKAPAPAEPGITPEQAEAWGTIMNHAHPILKDYFAHAERVNEQARIAARPVYWIAGGIVAAVSVAAVVVLVKDPTQGQLARELLLPLLAFAGGLGIGRASTPSK